MNRKKLLIGGLRDYINLGNGHPCPTTSLVIHDKKIYQVKMVRGVITPDGWKKAKLEVYDGEYYNFFHNGRRVEEKDLCDKYFVIDVTAQIKPLVDCTIESPYFQGISLDTFSECREEAILEAIEAYEKA